MPPQPENSMYDSLKLVTLMNTKPNLAKHLIFAGWQSVDVIVKFVTSLMRMLSMLLVITYSLGTNETTVSDMIKLDLLANKSSIVV